MKEISIEQYELAVSQQMGELQNTIIKQGLQIRLLEDELANARDKGIVHENKGEMIL